MDDPHRRDYAFLSEDPRAPSHDAPMFSGALSFCRRPYAVRLAGLDVAILGVPVDTAVSNRPGCRFGPRAIRTASAQLSWSRVWPSAFDPFERLAVGDWGDVVFDYGDPAGVPARIEAAVAAILEAGVTPIALGGDHSTSYPIIRAHRARADGPLALVQFDAHSDTWGTAGQESGRIDHGTMFRRAAEEGLIDPARSTQIGIRTTNDDAMGIRTFDSGAVHRHGPEAVVAAIRETVGDRPAYLSFDIDCLDPAFAPGTGTPVCGGLSSWQARECLRGLAEAGGIPLVGLDLVEVSPPYDHAEITALAGATLVLDMLCLLAVSRGRA